MAEYALDCTGLSCPMPIVRISKRMRELESGDTLVVEASDPAFKADVRAWVKRFGYEVVVEDGASVCRATITKA